MKTSCARLVKITVYIHFRIFFKFTGNLVFFGNKNIFNGHFVLMLVCLPKLRSILPQILHVYECLRPSVG